MQIAKCGVQNDLFSAARAGTEENLSSRIREEYLLEMPTPDGPPIVARESTTEAN
jgi:hypothetical protein